MKKININKINEILEKIIPIISAIILIICVSILISRQITFRKTVHEIELLKTENAELEKQINQYKPYIDNCIYIETRTYYGHDGKLDYIINVFDLEERDIKEWPIYTETGYNKMMVLLYE